MENTQWILKMLLYGEKRLYNFSAILLSWAWCYIPIIPSEAGGV
jgi:hypothetical protein